MKEQFVAKRIVNIGLIFLVAIGVSVIAGMMGRMYLDQLLGMGALTVLFMVLFAFLLIYERKRKKISNNRETDYGKILKGFLLSAILTVIFLFLPHVCLPHSRSTMPTVNCSRRTYRQCQRLPPQNKRLEQVLTPSSGD